MTLLPDDYTPPDFALLPPDPCAVTVGSTVRDVRRALGMTQKELAARAGVTFADVSQLENNRSQPGTLVRWRIIVALLPDDDALSGAARKERRA